MNRRKSISPVGSKRGQTKSGSEKGIFLGERRRHPRFVVELPLDYAVENKDRYGGIAANASTGGLLVHLSAAIVVGTLLNIELIFAKGFALNSIRASAKVIWADLAPKVIWGEYRYGLEFEKIQGEDRRKLKSLLITD